MTKEEFEKDWMKYKKKDMIDWLWRIREKNKVLREDFESIVDPATYSEHVGMIETGYDFFYFKFKAAIATYLGEKIQ